MYYYLSCYWWKRPTARSVGEFVLRSCDRESACSRVQASAAEGLCGETGCFLGLFPFPSALLSLWLMELSDIAVKR